MAGSLDSPLALTVKLLEACLTPPRPADLAAQPPVPSPKGPRPLNRPDQRDGKPGNAQDRG